jgi:mono/diheme cytochrome c family protein
MLKWIMSRPSTVRRKSNGRISAVLLAFLAAAVVFAAPSRTVRLAAAASPQAQPAAAQPAVPRALLDQYCTRCHNERLKQAGVMFDKVDISRIDAHRELFEKVVRKLRKGQMPPQGLPRPDDPTLNSFVSALETELDRIANATPNPGRVASRRLNRTEYVNAIRDLLALEIDGAALLPSDMAGFGFDNNADVLSMTPALMDRYMTTATKVSRLAVGTLDNRTTIQVYKIPNSARQRGRMGEEMPFATHGGLAVRHTFPLDGEYLLKVRLRGAEIGGTIAGNIAERQYDIELRVDHRLVKQLSVGGKFKGQVRYDVTGGGISVPEDDLVHQQIALYNQTADKDLEVRIPIKAGTRLVSASFTDSAPSSAPGEGDNAGAGIGSMEIRGPYKGAVPEFTPSRERIFSCRPTNAQEEKPCARKILTALARRAYRRPITDTDMLPLLKVYESGRVAADFEAGIERALEALLSMPAFLMRAEADPVGAKPGSTYRVSDLELASRLSFFLWRSIPDDELLDVAARGRLHEPAVLAQQTRRMLADRRSVRWMNDFLGQWLQVRNLRTNEPDPVRFPEFDDTLREAMIKETELFFESQVRDDRNILDLFRADYTYLNARLAEHYKVSGVYGNHFRRVAVADPSRRGLLGHGSVLTITSYADRTSVVLRGKWVLETLLGAPPPPPPPNVPPLKQNDGKAKPASLRERMEQHRKNAVCASCHNSMDPLGFALENFNAIGRWRDSDEGAAINAAITWNGKDIENLGAFRDALLQRGDEVARTVVEKLLTYALGRGLDYMDAPTVRHLLRDAARDDYRWSSVVLGIVASTPFQQRIVNSEDQQPATTVARVQ